MRRLALPALALLAACGSPKPAPAPQGSPTAVAVEATASASVTPLPSATPSAAPTPQPAVDLAVLDSRDCRTVAQAYADALARNDFAFAAKVWNDPAIDAARLQALLKGYKKPTIAIAGIEQEGAAGSLYCTVSGSLAEGGSPGKSTQKGEIVLRRVNDVPGATPAQLRWTIRSSTFVENLERAG